MRWADILVLCALLCHRVARGYCEWHLEFFSRAKLNYSDDPWRFTIDPSCTSVSCMTALWGAIDDTGAAAFASSLAHAPQLQELSLGYNNIGDMGGAALASALRHVPRLKLIFLGWNSIGDSGSAALAAALSHVPLLEELNLFWNNIGETGIVSLVAALKHNTKLKRLNLAWNNIGNAGATALADALPTMSGLVELSVAWSGIGDEGAAALARSLDKAPQLRDLRVKWNEFGDVGAAALAEAVVRLEKSRGEERLVTSGVPWQQLELARNRSAPQPVASVQRLARQPLNEELSGQDASHVETSVSNLHEGIDTVTCARTQCNALVLGNANYSRGGSAFSLGTRDDAQKIAEALERQSFVVSTLLDGKLKDMKKAVKAFLKTIEPGGVALVYFLGYAVQVSGTNYLLPVDFASQKETIATEKALSLASLLQSLVKGRKNAVTMLVVDALRQSPFSTSPSTESLAPVLAPLNTLVAFAHAPDASLAVAPNDVEEEKHSAYANQFIAQLEKPPMHVEQVFKRVRQRVVKETGERQIPWEASSLMVDFMFKRSTGRGEEL